MITHRLLFCLLATLTCANASAEGPLVVAGPGRLRDSDSMRGYTFSVGQQLTVTGLAKFDGNENGILDDLIAPHVGLWNAETGELLASAEIDKDAVFQGQLFVKRIDEPLVLQPGSYTLATQAFDDQEPYITNSDFESPFAVVTDLTPVLGRGSDFAIPDVTRAVLSFGPNLYLEQPPVTLSHPKYNSLVQRDANDIGMIPIAGKFDATTVNSVEVRAVSLDGLTATPWQSVPAANGGFSGSMEVPGGWHQVEARGIQGGLTIGDASVQNVGVGEIFVIAGQSNSANHGLPALATEDERVLALDTDGVWQRADDPQPRATGSGGSPWPVFGDLLASQLDVPVGIVSVGWGGTRVDQWLPDASGPDSDPLYDRLADALVTLGPNGARAVLWHQGESDALSRTKQQVYAERLGEVIDQSRIDAGFEIPWGVALAAFLPQNTTAAEAIILDAQRDVIRDDALVFAGPNTDLLGVDLRYDDIHFDEEGLRQHAALWVEAVLPLFSVEAFLEADFDENGTVEFADFLLLADAFGKAVAPEGTASDINGNGTVDFPDFLILANTFGQSTVATATIPEPTALHLLLIGGVLLGRARRSVADCHSAGARPMI